tara:strand:- start:305 stop:754 length:450 start_codon:yes stop_codon:yes gene_type:complete
MTIISGKAYWAAITSPNTTFEPKWQIDITLDAAAKAKVEADGLTIRNKGDDRGDFVSLKRNVTRASGQENQQPTLKDRSNRTMDNVMIGNGSDVNVKYRPYDTNWKGKAGKNADLQEIQVVNLISYGDSEDFDVLDEAEESFDDIPLAS